MENLRIATLYFFILMLTTLSLMFIIRDAPVEGMQIKASSYSHYAISTEDIDVDRDQTIESTSYIIKGYEFGMHIITLKGDNLAYYVGYDLEGDGTVDLTFSDSDGDGDLDFETMDVRSKIAGMKRTQTGEELLKFIHNITIQGFFPHNDG